MTSIADPDYWSLLGLEPGSSQDQLKRAFRQEARRWHPDLNGNDPVAEERFKLVNENPYLWSKVRIMYSNVRVENNKADFDLVINAPEDLMEQSVLDEIYLQLLKRCKDLGLDDIDLNISVIPNRVFRYDIDDRSSAKR